MSDEPHEGAGRRGPATDGALLLIGESVYFVPRDDLRSFKLPVAVAREVRGRLRERPELVRGHPNDPVLLGAELTVEGPILHFSSIYEHALTASRLH